MKQKKYKVFFKLLAGFVFFISALSKIYAASETAFTGFSINAQSDLLFSVRSKNSRNEFYETLFLKKSGNEGFEQLTFYPEKLNTFAEGKILQVSNKLGTITLDIGADTKQKLKSFSLFENSAYKQCFDSLQVSPSGRYVSIVEPTDFVFGDLVLFDLKTQKKFFVAGGVYQKEKAIAWAPDDSAFVFEKMQTLYFSRPTWLLEKASGTQPKTIAAQNTKSFTAAKIASGSIAAVKWIDKNTLYLIEHSKVYAINANKVLTSSLYDSVLQIKKQVQNLPFEFSAERDCVYFSKTASSILLLKDRKHVYFWDLQMVRENQPEANASIPYLLLPRNVSDVKVFWQNEKPILWFEASGSTEQKFSAWKVENNLFVPFQTSSGEWILSISDDARFALVEKNKTYSVKNLLTGKTVLGIGAQNIISSIWLAGNVLITGTDSELAKIDVQTGKTEMLLLSQVADFGWSKDETKILARVKSSGKVLENASDLRWVFPKNADEQVLPAKKSYNKNYRVYIDKANRIFSNMIYFRSIKDLGTVPLVNSDSKDNTFTAAQTATKKVALIFDVMENTNGLDKVLFVLNKNKVPATFFLTSEVIENAPSDILEIVRQGQQCASLFLAPLSLSDNKYTITEDFIASGLARTEDVFFKATKAELSLFWHTPYYIYSQAVVDIAKKAGYEFVLPTLILPDWIATSGESALPNVEQNSYALVNYIMRNVTDSSIIPIQLGTIKNRSDYLYDRLDLLLELLQTYGYEIVPLQEIKQ